MKTRSRLRHILNFRAADMSRAWLLGNSRPARKPHVYTRFSMPRFAPKAQELLDQQGGIGTSGGRGIWVRAPIASDCVSRPLGHSGACRAEHGRASRYRTPALQSQHLEVVTHVRHGSASGPDKKFAGERDAIPARDAVCRTAWGIRTVNLSLIVREFLEVQRPRRLAPSPIRDLLHRRLQPFLSPP